MTIHLRHAPDVEPPALRELVVALRAIIESSRYNTLTDLAQRIPGRVTKQRLSELVSGTRFPEFHEIGAVVQACDPQSWPRIQKLWHTARAERTARAAAAQPRLADRAVGAEHGRLSLVRDANWAELGVHRPITLLATGEDRTAEVDAGALPEYVLRDKDEDELRPALAAMAGENRPAQVQLMLVTGVSAAGKTRTAFEAMRATLPEWRLFPPFGPTSLTAALNDRIDLRHTVVWLDEIQQLLQQTDGIEAMKRLLALRAGPTVLLATLRAVRFPPGSGHRLSRTVVLLGGCPLCPLVSVGRTRPSTRSRRRVG